MPEYIFKTSTGEIVEQFFPMASAPRIGSIVKLADGRKGRRLPSTIRIEAWDPRHVAYGFPRRLDTTGPDEIQSLYPHTDEDGYCAFQSRREVDEFQAKTNGRYKYDA